MPAQGMGGESVLGVVRSRRRTCWRGPVLEMDPGRSGSAWNAGGAMRRSLSSTTGAGDHGHATVASSLEQGGRARAAAAGHSEIEPHRQDKLGARPVLQIPTPDRWDDEFDGCGADPAWPVGRFCTCVSRARPGLGRLSAGSLVSRRRSTRPGRSAASGPRSAQLISTRSQAELGSCRGFDRTRLTGGRSVACSAAARTTWILRTAQPGGSRPAASQPTPRCYVEHHGWHAVPGVRSGGGADG